MEQDRICLTAVQSVFFFKDLCSGDVGILANTLCNSKLTKEEIEELRKLLEDSSL